MITLEFIQAEIGYAMKDLRDEMETVKKHMETSSSRLYRFRKTCLLSQCEAQGQMPGNR